MNGDYYKTISNNRSFLMITLETMEQILKQSFKKGKMC